MFVTAYSQAKMRNISKKIATIVLLMVCAIHVYSKQFIRYLTVTIVAVKQTR